MQPCTDRPSSTGLYAVTIRFLGFGLLMCFAAMQNLNIKTFYCLVFTYIYFSFPRNVTISPGNGTNGTFSELLVGFLNHSSYTHTHTHSIEARMETDVGTEEEEGKRRGRERLYEADLDMKGLDTLCLRRDTITALCMFMFMYV